MTTIFEEHFNGPTHHPQGVAEISIPQGWGCFWESDAGESGDMRARPEAKVITRIAPYLDPPRIPTGETHAQQWFTFYKPHAAGIFRQLEIPAGTEVTASVQYHAWCSNNDDPHTSDQEEAYGMYGRLGLDPTGGIDPKSPAIVWSEQAFYFDIYQQILVTATAQETPMTIFIVSLAKWGTKHNDAYFSRLILATNGSPTPPPPPTDNVATLLNSILIVVQGLKDSLDFLCQHLGVT